MGTIIYISVPLMPIMMSMGGTVHTFSKVCIIIIFTLVYCLPFDLHQFKLNIMGMFHWGNLVNKDFSKVGSNANRVVQGQL